MFCLILVLAHSRVSSQPEPVTDIPEAITDRVGANPELNLQSIDDAAPYLKDGQALADWKELARVYYSQSISKYLAQGGDMKARTVNGSTVLHIAGIWVDRALVAKLIDRGADLNTKNYFGNTALSVAVEANNRDVVELLITEGAEINVTNNDGKTPLSQTKNQAMIQILRQYGAK